MFLFAFCLTVMIDKNLYKRVDSNLKKNLIYEEFKN